jgi:hypothetical protein
MTVTLLRPSVKQIGDAKVKLWRDWEAANNAPGEVRVRRGFDITLGCDVARITVRSTLPAHFRWINGS